MARKISGIERMFVRNRKRFDPIASKFFGKEHTGFLGQREPAEFVFYDQFP
jgi:hypothetical protein